jgi:glc operon protein GlcG
MGAGVWIPAVAGKNAPAVPVAALPGVAAASLPAPIYSQGAVPIVRDGVVDGAIGCGGGTAAQDQACAEAGAAAIAPPNRNN